MERDLRDPEAIGGMIQTICSVTDGVTRVRPSEIDLRLYRFQLIPEADGRYVGPLERYGDPRKLPEAYTDVEADGLTPSRRRLLT